jgi:hypothetical protein
MAGLIPAIHAYLCEMRREEDVDARDKRGHDDREAMSAPRNPAHKTHPEIKIEATPFIAWLATPQR